MFKVNVQWWFGGLFERDVTNPKLFGKCLARVYYIANKRGTKCGEGRRHSVSLYTLVRGSVRMSSLFLYPSIAFCLIVLGMRNEFSSVRRYGKD
jgi:hypothetical protein